MKEELPNIIWHSVKDRAREAKKYLANLGIKDSRMKTISYGKERPVDTGHNEDAWAKNRNAHFVVSAKVIIIEVK